MEKNKKYIMIIAYSMFAYMGIAFLSQGSLKIEMAESFGITTSKLQYLFTIFSTASMISVVSNKVLLERVPLKVEVLLSSTAILIGTFMMILTKNMNIFTVGMMLSGFGIGIYISLGSYLIINTFIKDRNSKLNFLHFCYSVSAVVTPIVAAALIGINLNWAAVYLLFLSLVILIIFLAFKTDFTEVAYDENSENGASSSKWDLRVYSSALMLFLYVFTEMIFSYWIVEYMVNLGSGSGESKVALSIFWLFIAIGRLVVGKVGNKLPVKNLVTYLLMIAFVSYSILMLVNQIWTIYIVVALLGIGFSSLYPSIISLGTEGRKNVSPSLMTFIMMSGSIGGIAYSPISGWVNSNYTIGITMGVGVITTLIMLLVGASFKLRK